MEKAEVFLGLQDFLDRMRQPSAADIVKSIKSFIVSFSHNAPDPERDSAAVQEFLSNMEATFRTHPLWAGCSEEDLESAGEGLEKYVMTKLFMRVFGSHPEDMKLDEQLSEKMALVQQFIHPENLDIKSSFLNETSLLLAQKELQKINVCKAPRDKLVCIMNCCKAINNLLFNASIASNENPPGADEFLPVLIFVTIKANPPQLHSNLAFIQRYRRKSCLVGEAAYVFTNMLSAESFVSNIDAKALSMDESEFETNMESARALLSGLSAENDNPSNSNDQMEDSIRKSEVREQTRKASGFDRTPVTPPKTLETQLRANVSYSKDQEQITKIPSLSELESKGATLLLKEEQVSKIFKDYPFLYATAGDLTLNDVEDLLNNYKQIVFKYVSLAKGMGVDPPSSPKSQTESPAPGEYVSLAKGMGVDPPSSSKSQTESPAPAESRELPEASQNLNINHELQDTDKTDDRVSLSEEEGLNTKSPQKELAS